MGYASYKQLSRPDRKAARLAMMKSTVSDDQRINVAAVEWAQHNLTVWWIVIAVYASISIILAVASQGRVIVVSYLVAIAIFSVLRLRSKDRKFRDLYHQARSSD